MDAIPATVEDVEACHQPDWAVRVEGTMINPSTLLATDYLNHFNEVLMLLQMVPDMPDMLEDCKEWKPKSYPQHFVDSGLKDGPLAAEAYAHSPSAYKIPFEAVIEQMNTLVATLVADLDAAIAAGELSEGDRHKTDSGVATLQTLNQMADSLIHGDRSTLDQSHIDKLLES